MANLEEIKNKLNSINNGKDYNNGDGLMASTINDIINSSKGIVENVEKLSSSKQDTLISGENIKTINGKSILGSGDLTIEGGDGKLYLHDISFIETNSLRFASMAILSTVKDACYKYDTINDLLNNSIAIIRWAIGVKDGAPNPKFASLHKGGEIPTYVYGGFGFVRNKGDVLYNGTPIQLISASREAEDLSWENEEYIKFIELNLADIAGEYANTNNDLVRDYTVTEWTSF